MVKRHNPRKPNANVDQQKAYHRLSLGGTSAYAGHLSSLVFGKIKSLWTAQTTANDGLNQLAKGMADFLLFGMRVSGVIGFRVWKPLTTPLSIFVHPFLYNFFRFLLFYYPSALSGSDQSFLCVFLNFILLS